MHPFSDVPYFSKISQPPGYNKKIGKHCCLTHLHFKINLRDTSFHIYLKSFGFYLSSKCLLNFHWLVYSTMCGKNFQFVVFTFLENVLNLCIFTHVPVPQLKTPGRIFWKFISCFHQDKRGGENYDLLYQNSSRKCEYDLENYFVWLVFFLTAMALQFCEKYLSKSVVLSLLPLLFNHGNLTLKLHQKYSYLNKGWLFIGRFKVASLPGMINKELLAQFIYKPT